MQLALPPGWRTRFAPAPTGYLHLGHAVNAVYVWGLARAFGGRVLLRIEDHDRGRYRPEYEAALLEDLEWLGLAPDGAVERQRDNEPRYAAAMHVLEQQGLVYPCTCSRRDFAGDAESANQEARYPGTCRDRGLDPGITPARRIRLDDAVEAFDDLRVGPQQQRPPEQCGDLLARDRLGHWTYQFAVTVDDMANGIDVVIRGEDLLESTGRQLALARMLGRSKPIQFLHHALIRKPNGEKLSKSAGDTGIRELRSAGLAPAHVLGRAAALAGLVHKVRPLSVPELSYLFQE